MRVAVILEPERDTRFVEVRLCALEIVLPDREREVPEPDRFAGDRGRRDTRQSSARDR